MQSSKEKEIRIVCDYFGCNRHKAVKYLKSLSPYDADVREMETYLKRKAKLAY